MDKDKMRARLETIKQEAEKIEKMLAEPEAKLRHGDYGIDFGEKEKDTKFPMLAFKPHHLNDPLRIAHADGSGGWEEDGADGIIWLGNIFDDLKRNSQDLREFEMVDSYGGSTNIKCEISTDWLAVIMDFGKKCVNCHFDLKDDLAKATKFHQNFGQLLATAIREQAKK